MKCESVQSRRTLVKARRRSSFSYPNQAPLIPYRTTDIETDDNDIRPLSTRRSEPSSRTSTPTLQNFSIASPELPSEPSIATPTSTELRANPFYQPTRQQVLDFNFVQQQLRQHQAIAPQNSFWTASSRESISSSQITPRSSLTLSTQNKSSEENVSNTYSQIESSLVSEHSPIVSSIIFGPAIRLPENYTGPRGPILPAIHNQNPPTRSRTREHTQIFLLDHTSDTPAPVLYGRTSLGDTSTNWSRERPEHTLNLTTRQRQNAINVLSTSSLELHFQSTTRYNTIFNHPIQAATSSITTRTTPPPFNCTEFIYKFDRYTQQTPGFASFYNPYTGLTYTCRFS